MSGKKYASSVIAFGLFPPSPFIKISQLHRCDFILKTLSKSPLKRSVKIYSLFASSIPKCTTLPLTYNVLSLTKNYINMISSFEAPYFNKSTLKKVIKLYTITLQAKSRLTFFAKNFFISKQEYIRDKRLMLLIEIKKRRKNFK